MFGFIWRLFGYHVCRDFTQWTRYEQTCIKQLCLFDIPIGTVGEPYVKIIQRRACMECGKFEEGQLVAEPATWDGDTIDR